MLFLLLYCPWIPWTRNPSSTVAICVSKVCLQTETNCYVSRCIPYFTLARPFQLCCQEADEIVRCQPHHLVPHQEHTQRIFQTSSQHGAARSPSRSGQLTYSNDGTMGGMQCLSWGSSYTCAKLVGVATFLSLLCSACAADITETWWAQFTVSPRM